MTGKRVAAIDVTLDKPWDAEALAKRLKLNEVRSVPVLDDAGQPLGIAFPERGVLFSFAPSSKLVTQMLMEAIDAEPFILRAAADADYHPRRSLQDLEFALQVDPQNSVAHDLRAQVLLAVGRANEALRSAEKAAQIEPKNAAYQLSKAEILTRLGRQSDAMRITKDVLARTELPPLLKARALCQLADLTAAAEHDGHEALQLRLSAIKAAGPLLADKRVGIRRQAKRVLIDAHLGAATDIAWGTWQQKQQIVPKWIHQADDLADDLIEHEEADPQLRLHVARQALHAAAGMQGKWDPGEWAKLVADTGKHLLDDTDDPLRHERIEWEMGQAMCDGLEVAQARGLTDRSLAESSAALRHLEAGVSHRQPTSDDTDRLGWLYYRVGVIHAVVKRDHATAVTWFDRALPLLDHPVPAPAADLGRRGEALVSMGISYWETGNRQQGLRPDAARGRSDGSSGLRQAARRQIAGNSLRQSGRHAPSVGPSRSGPIIRRTGRSARTATAVRAGIKFSVFRG